MHIDLEKFDRPDPRPTEFCILGGGIAGLILAQRLAGCGRHVSILEAGGLELEERSQALFEAEMMGTRHIGATHGRFRSFGGTSTRWGGQLLPLTGDIFQPVAGAPSLSWPIEEFDLTGYYSQVQTLMHVGSLPFTDTLLPALGQAPVDLSPEIRLRFSKWIPFRKRNLAGTIGRELIAHPSVTLYTHANTASLHGDGSRIRFARVLDYQGRSFAFRAEHFIVCCGTIESSRLLLASPGVANSHDQLGRYFHDHISLPAAELPSEARAQVLRRLGPFVVGGVVHSCKLEAVSELQRDHRLLAVKAYFTVREPEDSGTGAVRNLLVARQRNAFPAALAANLWPLLGGLPEVARLLWFSRVLKRRAVSRRAVMRLNLDIEQPGTPENRIRLSTRLDALGLAKAVVDWRVGDREYDTAHRFAHIIKHKLEAGGFPPLLWTPGLLEGVRPTVTDYYHPMGGLRMGHNPATSVVDSNLKVHGLDNLHVASCAVYPSGGSANPTFTLMALALRLADRLTRSAVAAEQPEEAAELIRRVS